MKFTAFILRHTVKMELSVIFLKNLCELFPRFAHVWLKGGIYYEKIIHPGSGIPYQIRI